METDFSIKEIELSTTGQGFSTDSGRELVLISESSMILLSTKRNKELSLQITQFRGYYYSLRCFSNGQPQFFSANLLHSLPGSKVLETQGVSRLEGCFLRITSKQVEKEELIRDLEHSFSEKYFLYKGATYIM
jgi:hypothetical protein